MSWNYVSRFCTITYELKERSLLNQLSDKYSGKSINWDICITTMCSVLKVCGEENFLKFGRQLHGIAVKKLIKNDVYIGTALVDMYARCGEIEESRKVFDRMKRRNMVTWTSIIAGVLRACGSISALVTGKEVHAQALKKLRKTTFMYEAIVVWLYCKCGEYDLASKVLHRMPLRGVVSWTALISGCTHSGYEFKVLEFSKKMLSEGVEPDLFTYSSILKACASLEAIQQGKLIHSTLKKSSLFSNNVIVESALINMYAKCGYVSDAFQGFSNLKEENLVSWRSMIVGYASNGHCREALKLICKQKVFKQMIT